jgi:hypothetical protein
MCLIAARSSCRACSRSGCEPRYTGHNWSPVSVGSQLFVMCAARASSSYDHQCESSVLVPNRTKEISAENAAKKELSTLALARRAGAGLRPLLSPDGICILTERAGLQRYS